VACPPSDTRRRCRTGAPTGALALHPARRFAQHTGLERESVGPAPIVRRSTPISSSRASGAVSGDRSRVTKRKGNGPAIMVNPTKSALTEFGDWFYAISLYGYFLTNSGRVSRSGSLLMSASRPSRSSSS